MAGIYSKMISLISIPRTRGHRFAKLAQRHARPPYFAHGHHNRQWASFAFPDQVPVLESQRPALTWRSIR